MKEIERKYLVKDESFKNLSEGVLYKQGYIVNLPDRVVRVRIAGEKAFLTIKGENTGISRSEYEYKIPVEEAAELLDTFCGKLIIEKYRFTIEHEGREWIVDQFLGDNEGLIITEVELGHEDEEVTHPDWVGAEVSYESRYYNSNLIKHPFKDWET